MPHPRSADRILTTHVGSLPRPAALLDLMKAKYGGLDYDEARYEREIAAAVHDVVARQVAAGIDVVTDGEMSKPGFFSYVRERLSGFAPRPGLKSQKFKAEIDAFPEYYEQYMKRAMYGAAVAPNVPIVCTGPIQYTGEAPLARDIANLKAAAASAGARDAFMPAVAPSLVGGNEYYRSDEDFYAAVGEAMRTEYRMILDAGLLLQVDDPYLSEILGDELLPPAERTRRADLYVEAVNHSLRGLPQDRIRFHTCYGINEGPRVHEAQLSDVVGHMLRVNACAYSFEAANARHAHEYHLWERVKLPEGKIIMPGVVTHASNIVEHPELIAERIVRHAKLVGRENVIASADCGFSSQACYQPEVHPKVMWAKFEAMREGARLATRALWPR